MGIDVYAKWNGQTEEERQAQYTGFSTRHGYVGYLREAYHGDPYATKVLFPECFDDTCEGMREVISDIDIAKFEEWAAPIRVSSGNSVDELVLPKMREYFGQHAKVQYDGKRDEFTRDSGAMPIPAATLRERLPAALEAARQRELTIYSGDAESIADAQKSFSDFVELYEQLDAEGKEPRVYVSY